MSAIVKDMRESGVHKPYVDAATGENVEIKIYGEFAIEGKPASPDHVWIEVDGTIYETFHKIDLWAQKATEQSRQCPNSLHFRGFTWKKDYELGTTKSQLTIYQRQNIIDLYGKLGSKSRRDGEKNPTK